MKFSATISFLIAISMASADVLSDCKCGTGYKPTKTNDGKVQCDGIMLLHSKPCNIPEYPHCDCSGTVTGILSDYTGTWCSENKLGKEQRRWRCENTQEWDTFYREHPDLVPKTTTEN